MKRRWTVEELEEHWTLDREERRLVGNKTGPTRLGFTVTLKYFQLEGQFPSGPGEIPEVAVAHVATQVDVAAEQLLKYQWEGRTAEYHRAQIRQFTGFREATDQDADDLRAWLLDEVVPRDPRVEQAGAALYDRCRARQIEPPSATRVERLVHSALHEHDEDLHGRIASRLSPEVEARLADLCSTPEDDGESAQSILAQLKESPGRVGLDTVLAEVAKLRRLRALGLSPDLFDDVPRRVVHAYRERAAAESPSHLKAHPAPLKATLLAALCWLRTQEITDGLLDLLIELIHRIAARAERRVVKELLSDLKRVNGKMGVLFRLSEAAIEHPDDLVKAVIYPAVGEQVLRDLVREFRSTGPAYRFHVQTYLRASYSNHYRRMLPAILAALEFRSNNALHRPVIEALEVLRHYATSTSALYPPAEPVPVDGVVPNTWRELVVQSDGRGRERVNRLNYEICVLQGLREKLRCKEIWVVGADRYRNPDQDLPADFDERRASYYAELRQPTEAEAFVAGLKQSMAAALESLDAGMPTNAWVKILPKANGWISLSPLEPQPEPPNLGRLKAEVGRRWPMTSLLDILKETDLRVGFTECFTSVAPREVIERPILQKRLLLCLYALGTNTGLKRVAAGDQGESYQDLRYVRRRFISAEALREATAQVVNATLQARLPQLWGEGTTACASDSKKFAAWDQNLMTEWHIRYRGRGVMIYWHVERKASCIYSQLKTCSSSEVAAMIEGLLRHCTDMDVERNYVDSHGQSEVAFAFCHLLGFQLLPRLKAIHAQRLYRPQGSQPGAYPNLQPVLSRPINWELIRNQYDEMVKYATALRVGTADTEAILRRFTRNSPQHPTYQALAELGKAAKTIFLCQYLSSPELRREIHEGLNVVENWNGTNAFIFYGRGGEISTNRPDDQELAVLSLQLLQNSLVYVNTLLLQAVAGESRWLGSLAPEDLRGLTPLIYAHVNPYGTFHLDMGKRLPIEPPRGMAA